MKLREHDVISRKKVINSWHFVFNFKQKVCHFEVRWVIIHIFVRKMLIQFISILLWTKYSSDIVHCTLYRVSNNNSAARNWAQLHAIDASILVHNYRPERTGFNMYAENTQQQLTFLALLPCRFPCYCCLFLFEYMQIFSEEFIAKFSELRRRYLAYYWSD